MLCRTRCSNSLQQSTSGISLTSCGRSIWTAGRHASSNRGVSQPPASARLIGGADSPVGSGRMRHTLWLHRLRERAGDLQKARFPRQTCEAVVRIEDLKPKNGGKANHALRKCWLLSSFWKSSCGARPGEARPIGEQAEHQRAALFRHGHVGLMGQSDDSRIVGMPRLRESRKYWSETSNRNAENSAAPARRRTRTSRRTEPRTTMR